MFLATVNMKSWFLLLLFCISAHANDFRLVGTNLYDFTFADANSGYRVCGKVSKVYPKSVEVTIQYGIAYQRYMFGDPAGLISPSDMSGMKAGDPDAIERGVAVANMLNSSDYAPNRHWLEARSMQIVHTNGTTVHAALIQTDETPQQVHDAMGETLCNVDSFEVIPIDESDMPTVDSDDTALRQWLNRRGDWRARCKSHKF
jgi:uncharacterized protein YndB with AHSA1/START domain